MKKIYLILCIFFGILLTTKPVDAKVNEELLSKYKKIFYDKYNYQILYDKEERVYLQYNGSQGITIVSFPDAKKGETTLVIPDTVEIEGKVYNIVSVGDYSKDEIIDYGLNDDLDGTIFTLGKGYKKIIFGKNVSSVKYGVFWDDKTLEEIQFLGNDIRIGEYSFSRCKNLKQITGSEKISFIDENAFSCTAITNFNISDKCSAIRDGAFSGCTNLKELPDISKVKELGESIFVSCHGLKKIILADGLKEIPDYMFSDCKNVKEVYIPKSVKEIGETPFWGSTKLKGNVTIDPRNRHFTAKDNMILNKKGDTLLSMISPVKVMVIPSYVKKVKSYWAQDYYKNKYNHKMLETIIVQNKNIKFLGKSVPCWYSPGHCKQKINILYPDTRDAFAFTEKQIDSPKKYKLSKIYSQHPYTLYPAPTGVKAKLKKGKVQVSFKKLKDSAVKKYKITYRIKKNGKYKAQKEKVIKGKRATLCTLNPGEICEVRVSAYTKQSGVWLPGKFSRMVKVRGKE